ncbi:DUF2529 domain-containing protein [Shouchella clausii]|uniref:DUF2529 domain-containing protein n=1 Tax=Shouchella clausii TaxID=79880 RepID=UPI000BA62D2F|nr:DUF2529 domain-containing protein [Shouchella clausii]MBX0318855.1 DUF2529 domain-containing protein [Shouchella clausii]MCM3311220.1 DUF2529 domain-containing protein [Psychrobacillus sp. MER TA 17]PAE96332.1 hypothetical protein CHH70_02080 [Shouchella clausii]
MLKIFSTQLFGLIKSINETQEEHLEDAGRLLAQAIIAQGNVYIKGFAEMEAIELAAFTGYESMPGAAPFPKEGSLSGQDRCLLFAPSLNHEGVQAALKACEQAGIAAVVVSSRHASSTASLAPPHLFLDTGVKGGLVPDETGKRIGHPGVIAGLYVYHGLKFVIHDILEEYC